jgi:hypothetical protein
MGRKQTLPPDLIVFADQVASNPAFKGKQQEAWQQRASQLPDHQRIEEAQYYEKYSQRVRTMRARALVSKKQLELPMQQAIPNLQPSSINHCMLATALPDGNHGGMFPPVATIPPPVATIPAPIQTWGVLSPPPPCSGVGGSSATKSGSDMLQVTAGALTQLKNASTGGWAPGGSHCGGGVVALFKFDPPKNFGLKAKTDLMFGGVVLLMTADDYLVADDVQDVEGVEQFRKDYAIPMDRADPAGTEGSRARDVIPRDMQSKSWMFVPNEPSVGRNPNCAFVDLMNGELQLQVTSP